MNRMVRGQKCEMAKLHVSLQLQYSASIMIPQHMTAADLVCDAHSVHCV